MEMKDLTKELVDLQYIVDSKSLDVDVFELYGVFYDEHKHNNGGNKQYLQDSQYQQKMDQRYDYIICSINEIVERYKRKKG